MQKPRHAKNVEGDFYVVEGCCAACGIWEGAGDRLIAWDNPTPNSFQCYVRRQPKSRQEIDDMMDVMFMADLDCFRYAGEDPVILQKIVNIERAANCDSDAVKALRPTRWHMVRFRPLPGQSATPGDFATLLRGFLEGFNANETDGEVAYSFRDLDAVGMSVGYVFRTLPLQTMTFRRGSVEGYLDIVLTPPLPADRAYAASRLSDWLDTVAAERAWLTAEDVLRNRPGSSDYY